MALERSRGELASPRGEILSSLKENVFSLRVRSEVRMLGASDIAEGIKGHNKHFEFAFTKNTSHIEHNDLD